MVVRISDLRQRKDFFPNDVHSSRRHSTIWNIRILESGKYALHYSFAVPVVALSSVAGEEATFIRYYRYLAFGFYRLLRFVYSRDIH